MAERECVLCGAPGVKERCSCIECGGTVVEVREFAFAGVAVSPAHEQASGSSGWSPSAGGSELAPEAGGTDSPERVAVRARARRALVLAWVVFAGSIATSATIGYLRWQARSQVASSLPAAIEAYTTGEGNTYRTAYFTARLPKRPRIERQYLRFGLRFEDGRSLPVTVATTEVSGVRVDVGHGALDATLTSEVHTAISEGGSGLEYAVGDDSEVDSHEITLQGAGGFDEMVDTGTGSARIRILFHGSRIVYVVVAGEHDVDAVFDEAVESLRLR